MPSIYPLLPSLPNFRDLGGIPTDGGRRVRAHRFFRSQRLTGLSVKDKVWLDEQDIGAILDFRSHNEASAAPNEVSPALKARQLSVPIEPTAAARFQDAQAKGILTNELAHSYVVDTYADYVINHSDAYARLLQHLAHSERPVVFHCSAGKDRTGFAAALILAVLGAPKHYIINDFLRSNTDWQPPPDISERVPEHCRPAILQVDTAYLDAAFKALDRLHGGAEQFAADALGGQSALTDFRVGATVAEPV